MAFSYSVNVHPFQSAGKAKAFASLIIEDVLEIKGFKIIDGKNGLFVSPPQKEGKPDPETGDRKWWPDVIFHEDRDPDNGVYKGPVQEEIERTMIAEYQSKSSGNRSDAARSHQGRSSGGNSSRPTNPMGQGSVW